MTRADEATTARGLTGARKRPGERRSPARVPAPGTNSLFGLQRQAGNQAVAQLIAAGTGPPIEALAQIQAVQRAPVAAPPPPPSPPQAGPGAARRKRAAALGAVNARLALAVQFPVVLAQLGDAQVEQVQTVLDSVVINPDAQGRAKGLRKRATKMYGALAVTDPKLADDAVKAAGEAITLSPDDHRLRLDHKRLLAPDTFKPRTDNPDEARFLKRLKHQLDEDGVWLRMTPERGAALTLWLSLGPEGAIPGIPAPLGALDRQALLATDAIGAAFYTKVDKGPVSTDLDEQAGRIGRQIRDGLAEHLDEQKTRRRAAFGVPWISDKIGGAQFPSLSIWDRPSELHSEAVALIAANRTREARPVLAAAATVTGWCATALAVYERKTVDGATIAAKWLQRAETAGKVARTVLLVASGAGAVGLEVTVGESGAEAGGLAMDAETEAELQKILGPLESDPEMQELTKGLQQVKGPNEFGTIDRGSQARGQRGVGFRDW